MEISFRFAMTIERKSKGNQPGTSWGHLLQISLFKLMGTQMESSFSFVHDNYQKINRNQDWKLLGYFLQISSIKCIENQRKQAWKLLEPLPLDLFITTNIKSIETRLEMAGSSWDQFLQRSLFKLIFNQQEINAFPLDLFIKTHGRSIGNKPGSSWSHFLQISL